MSRQQQDLDLVTRTTGESLTVRRAFGEPSEHDGVTVIPVAKVLGGSGTGFGSGELGGSARQEARTGSGEGAGGGGGFGVRVRPIGVFVIAGGNVTWRPAVDVNRALLGAQLAGMVIALAWAFRRRRR